jgi:hypothetical protein
VLQRSTSKRSAGEVSVRDTRKFFGQPITAQLALSAGLLLLAVLGPVAQLVVSDLRVVVSDLRVIVPAQRGEMPEVTPSQVLQAALKLPQAIVTKATIKLDLAGISPAEFGDWEEPVH